jgi:anti-anti-sigma regulatory factor
MEITSFEPDPDRRSAGLEVTTVSADTLRASIKVVGALRLSTAPLLTSVLRTHVSAGRRYLRIDLATARMTDTDVVSALADAHRTVAALGGMLLFENADPRLVDALRDTAIFAAPSKRAPSD